MPPWGLWLVGVSFLVSPSRGVPRPSYTLLENTDFPGDAFKHQRTETMDECAEACIADPKCAVVTWNGPNSDAADSICNLKCSASNRIANSGEFAAIIRSYTTCSGTAANTSSTQRVPAAMPRAFPIALAGIGFVLVVAAAVLFGSGFVRGSRAREIVEEESSNRATYGAV